jgi:hypothetical protein
MDTKPKSQFSKLIRTIFARKRQAIFLPGESDLFVHDQLPIPHRMSNPSSTATITLAYPSASLLGCPGEIRNQIYYYLFSDPPTTDRLKSLQYDGEINQNAAFLQTCQQVYNEARHIARPNFLLVPKHMSAGVKCMDTLTLPINDQKIIRILQGPTPPDLLKTLVLREYLHNIILYWHPPTGKPSIPVDLHVETVYVQLCICESITWILNSTSWANAYAYALTQFLQSHSSIKRVVTYFCGLEGDPRLFAPTSVNNQMDFPKLIQRVLTRVTTASAVMSELGVPGWAADKVDGEENCWDLRALPIMEIGERSVRIEFYNSSTVCEKKCVLE